MDEINPSKCSRYKRIYMLPANVEHRGRTAMWEDVMESFLPESKLDIVRVCPKIFKAMQCYLYIC
jgi:hypothetical protein